MLSFVFRNIGASELLATVIGFVVGVVFAIIGEATGMSVSATIIYAAVFSGVLALIVVVISRKIGLTCYSKTTVNAKGDCMPKGFFKKFKNRQPVKARSVYITVFVLFEAIALAGFIALAVLYPTLVDISDQGMGQFAALLLTVIAVVNFFYPFSCIGFIKSVTCPVCKCVYSMGEGYEHSVDVRKGTDYKTETYDVNIGRAQVGDHSVDIYQKQNVKFKRDYTIRSSKIKCTCIYCGYDRDEYRSQIKGDWKEV